MMLLLPRAPDQTNRDWIVASCDADGKVALHGDIELKRLQKEEVERRRQEMQAEVRCGKF